jgi:hypothetical protein
MNIFYLDNDPKICAEMHCDKHVVKMIIEYAQLMSTAHRMLDGTEWTDKTANGRNIKRWRHPSTYLDATLYKASHVNHPSAIWTRQSQANYEWLYQMWIQLCFEYTIRYKKTHAPFEKLATALRYAPVNIPSGEFSEPPPAMPDYCKEATVIASYRKYYIMEKQAFAKWKNAITPKWFKESNYAVI